MQDHSSSSTATVANGSGSVIGGTSFLDLPFELRTMIYDLSLAKRETVRYFPLPGQPRPAFKGINILRTSKQIYEEASQRVWRGYWIIRLPLPIHCSENRSSLDCSLAMSCLHDAALARVRFCTLFFNFGKDNSGLTLDGFECLLKLKSLVMLEVIVHLRDCPDICLPRKADSLENMPFLIALVVLILPCISCAEYSTGWYLKLVDLKGQHQNSDALKKLASRYGFMRGSAIKEKILANL